jgi:hypothetical protein
MKKAIIITLLISILGVIGFSFKEKNEITTIFVNIFLIFLFIGIIEAILKANKNASTIDI